MKHTNDLGRDPIRPLVLRLTIPTMIAQLVNVLYSIVDRIYIGNIPGDGALALAGAGICGPIVTLLSSFGSLVGIGGSILFAIRLGEKNQAAAKKILANSFFMLLVLSAVLTVTFLLCKEPLLWQFGASALTFPYADTYLSIYTMGTFFALMAIGLNYFITSQGFSVAGMTTVLIGAVLNIILDPILIFGLHLGIAGAAIATVISQMCSCLFVLCFLFSRRSPIRITFGGYDGQLIKRITFLGLSPFLILFTDSVIIIGMNAVLQRFGGKSQGDMLITCVTIVQSYMLLITAPMLGITSGSQPIISFNYGAVQSDRVKKAIGFVLQLCIGFTAVMFLLSQLLPHYFVRIFTQDPAYIRLSSWGIRVFTAAIIPLAFQYVLVDSLTALSATHFSLGLSLFRKSSYFGFTCLLPVFFGAKSAFCAEPLADLIASLVTTLTFLLVYPKIIRAREEGRL